MKILAAVDRSPFADLVVDMTRRVAASEPSTILLMSVGPREPDVLGKQLTRKVIEDVVPEDLQDRREELDRLVAVLRAAGLTADTLLIRGEPAATIQREAKRWGADLIVIGSHGRRMLQRKILGSVSEATMRRGQFPALIVFAPAATLKGYKPPATAG